MADKGQKRGNRELKKPKKKPTPTVPSIVPTKADVAPARAPRKS